MKKVNFYLLTVALLLTSISFAQINYPNEAKKELDSLNKEFQKIKSHYEREKDTLIKYSERLSPLVVKQFDSVKVLHQKMDSLYIKSKTTWDYYKLKGVSEKILNTYFKLPKEPPYEFFNENLPNGLEEVKVKKEDTFLIFGDEQLILKKDFLEDTIARKIFNNIVSDERKIHLGDFWIPKNGEEVLLVSHNLHECKKAFLKQRKRLRKEEAEKDIPIKRKATDKGNNSAIKEINKKIKVIKRDIEKINKKIQDTTRDKDLTINSKWKREGFFVNRARRKSFEALKKLEKCGDKKLIHNTLKFEKIDLDLYEGSLVDIKVYLKNDNGDTYLFENKLSVSLIYYPVTSQRLYLRNTAQESYEDKSNDYSNFKLRLSDVLRYFSKPGKNFIPDNQSFSFPLLENGKKYNSSSSNVYELHQMTSLENVLDIRTYTDFLSLFGDSPNGVAQFEGQAEFFVNPYKITNTPFFIFKKIKPYVSFSRLDEDDRSLDIKTDSLGVSSLKNRLDNLQKSYLDLGLKLDFLNFSLGKEYPFEVNFFGSTRYQLAELKQDSLTKTQNYKTLGIGGGINLDFRRYDNFSFSFSSELTRYNTDSFNDIENFNDSNNFWVFRNEGEISYHTGNSKKNAIFLRLRVFDDLGSDIDSNFFQFQFGYKFSLGIQKIKSKG